MNPAEMTVAAPQEALVVETGLPPGAVDSATTEQPPPTPEQVRAAEVVFSQEQESQAALNLLGLWTSAVLLRDLALDHFSRAEEEEEEAPRERERRRE
jgi:hypothetical protein